MSIEQTIGIDVAKAHLDIAHPGFGVKRIANEEAALRKWAETVPAQRVTLEASGGYERTAVRVLGQLGFEVEVLNPRKVRRIADALGFGAKTDRLDAELLSRVGGILSNRCTPSAQQTALRDKTRHVRRLSNALGNLRKQLDTPELDSCVERSLMRQIHFLEEELRLVRREIQAELTEIQRQTIKLIRSIPGVGIETSAVLVAELPESLEGFTNAELCSYAGLAPMDASSGTWTGRKRIRRGNGYLKRILYCAALVTLRIEPASRSRYDNLRAKGKAHQQAAVTLMRRLLIRVLVVMRRQKPWEVCTST